MLAREGWDSEITIERDYRVARERDQGVFQSLRRGLKGGKTIPILDLVKLLGVEDLLLAASVLAHGTCTGYEDADFTRGECWVKLRYSMHVPGQHRSLLRAHADELPSKPSCSNGTDGHVELEGFAASSQKKSNRDAAAVVGVAEAAHAQ